MGAAQGGLPLPPQDCSRLTASCTRLSASERPETHRQPDEQKCGFEGKQPKTCQGCSIPHGSALSTIGGDFPRL